MPLFVSEGDLDTGKALVDLHSGDMKTLFVYGNEANLMIATRSGGYHSIPHRHVPEQLNYVIEGELWIFIGDRCWHLRKGDFLRIPGNELHWAWNRSDGPCVMAQVHAPVLDPDSRAGTFALFDEGETPNVKKSPRTVTEHVDVTELERKALARHGVTI